MDWTINAMRADDVDSIYELYMERRKLLRQQFVTQCMVISHGRLMSADYLPQLSEHTLYYCSDNGRVYLYNDGALHCITTEDGRDTFEEDEFNGLPRANTENDYDPYLQLPF